MRSGTARTDEFIALMSAKATVFICVTSLIAIVGFKAFSPDADVNVFLHVFLIAFGNLTGRMSRKSKSEK